MVLHLYFRNKQSWLQSWSAHWPTSTSVSGTSWLQSWSAHWPTSTSVSGTSWLQSWSAHWPTSTSVSGTKLICTLGLLQPLFQEQSWLLICTLGTYFNLCFRNKVDLLTGPTSTYVSGTKLICTLGLLYVQNIYRSVGIAQRVDHPTGKPGAILMCRFESQVWQGTFLPEPASSADSLMVSAQPPCAIACINICAHVKNLKHWQPYHCLDTQNYCTHGSTAR